MTRLAVLLFLFVAVVFGSPAGAQVSTTRALLEEGDAVELANKLAEATEEQDVCYGWIVNVDDQDRGFFTDDGSSLGPTTSPTDPTCTPSVVFVADLIYTSELSESTDSASIRVESTLPGFQLTGDDFAPFGVNGRALLGDNDDVALVNAVSALPLLVAEAGLAPPVQPEQTTGTIPAADGPTGGGGSDRLRTYGSLYFLAITMIVGGIAWFVIARFLRSYAAAAAVADAGPRPRPHDPDPTGARPWTS